MEIGVISWATNCGLSTIVDSWRKNLPIQHYLSVLSPGRGIREDWTKEADIVTATPITVNTLKAFYKKIDLLLVCENPLCPFAYKLAKNMGIKTVLIPRWEWVYWGLWQDVDWFIADTKCCYDFLTRNLGFDNVSYIPHPVDTELFRFANRENANLFLHNAGWGGIEERKNTRAVIEAFNGTDIPLLIRTQKKLSFNVTKNILIQTGNDDNPLYCYRYGEVAVQPSKFEGLGLTILEAMSCGIPVITTDAPPMNEYFSDKNFLVQAKTVRGRRMQNPSAPKWEINIEDLRRKVRNLYGQNIREKSEQVRQIIEKTYSWKAQGEKFLDILEKVYKEELKKEREITVDDLNEGKLPFKIKNEV